MGRDVYATPAWRLARKAVLARDGRRCQLGLPGCRGWADAVDHRVELFEGGAPFALENLVAACTPCNSKKHAAVLARRASMAVRSW